MPKKSAFQKEAWRRWPNAVDIEGDGPIAFVTYCRDIKVSLHETIESAQAVRRWVDAGGCGGGCYRNHEAVILKGKK